MNAKVSKLLIWQDTLSYRVQFLIQQMNPHTAIGEGLDDIARAIEIAPRREKYLNLKETDQELRERILTALQEISG